MLAIDVAVKNDTHLPWFGGKTLRDYMREIMNEKVGNMKEFRQLM